ncbi:MAG: hypothetical protein MI755_20660 [Sphingomonadales bacterium]|nr:hypothetical protein [Sphingomonadales bacterium]
MPDTDVQYQATKKLRFAVLVDDENQTANWVRTTIEKLISDGDAELVLVVVNERADEPVPPILGLKHFLFRLWFRLFVRLRENARVPLADLFDGVDRLGVKFQRKGKYGQIFRPEDIETFRSYRLDFAFRVGFGILKGEVLEVPRYGVWSFHHGDERVYRGMPSGFWEIRDNAPVLGGILQQLTDQIDAGRILMRFSVPVQANRYAASLDAVRRLGAELPAQLSRRLASGATDILAMPPSTTSAPMRYVPTNGKMIPFLALSAFREVGLRLRNGFRWEDWAIGIVTAKPEEFSGPAAAHETFWIKADTNSRFVADPFGCVIAGELHVLFERYDRKLDRGVISRAVVSLDAEGRPRQIRDKRDSLILDSHLSYPFVVTWKSDIYVIPESARENEVALYRYDADGGTLERVRTLVAGCRLADPTVLVDPDGRIWLLGTTRVGALVAFQAEDLIHGEFVPSSANPISVDSETARCGGTPFIAEGQVYRWAQCPVPDYGRKLHLIRIDQLTPGQVRETVVKTIESPFASRPDGIHTASQAGPFMLFDARRYRYSASRFIAKAGRKLGADRRHDPE